MKVISDEFKHDRRSTNVGTYSDHLHEITINKLTKNRNILIRNTIISQSWKKTISRCCHFDKDVSDLSWRCCHFHKDILISILDVGILGKPVIQLEQAEKELENSFNPNCAILLPEISQKFICDQNHILKNTQLW